MLFTFQHAFIPFSVTTRRELKNAMNPNQFMHQNQILDGLKRSSKTIRTQWMVFEDLRRLSEPALNQILDGLWRPFRTIQNLILMHKLIRNRRGSDSTNKTNIFTAHKRSLGKVIFAEACACVSHSVGGGGGRGLASVGACVAGVCMAGCMASACVAEGCAWQGF